MVKCIVGLFCGTRYNFDNYDTTDRSFNKISKAVKNDASDDVLVYGYNGSHQYGINLFAFGTQKPCDDLYEKVVSTVNANKKEGKNEKLKLFLHAHSRGCISALMLIKKINETKELKDAVEIVIDFRDPVPGNLKVSSTLDVADKIFIANELRDMSNCSNITHAHITIQELGSLDIGFSVLIPTFHPNTVLDIEFLPGLHDIQQRKSTYDYFYEANKLIASKDLYNLGLKKSLQILKENFDAAGIPHKIVDTIQEQCDIYTRILGISKSRKIKSRDLHFGGQFTPVADEAKKNATHLNVRHAKLSGEQNSNLLLTFKGDRPDIKYANTLDVRIGALLSDLMLINKKLENFALTPQQKELIRFDSETKHVDLHRLLILSKYWSFKEKNSFIDVLLGIKPENSNDANYILFKLHAAQNVKYGFSIIDDFKEELEQYKIERSSNHGKSQKEYLSIWGNITGMTATIKLSAANKMLDALNGKTTKFSTEELVALTDSRLGGIVSRYNAHLPQAYKKAVEVKARKEMSNLIKKQI